MCVHMCVALYNFHDIEFTFLRKKDEKEDRRTLALQHQLSIVQKITVGLKDNLIELSCFRCRPGVQRSLFQPCHLVENKVIR